MWSMQLIMVGRSKKISIGIGIIVGQDRSVIKGVASDV